MGAMLGVVLSENLIQLLIFWELTSLSPSCSSATGSEREEEARHGARMALAVTGAGGWPAGGFCCWANHRQLRT
jgi:multicomponent K+:H+ antiporter subunit A